LLRIRCIGPKGAVFMKHRTSGWFAWISLALIIGVPSSEIFFSKNDKNDVKNIADGVNKNSNLPVLLLNDNEEEPKKDVSATNIEEQEIPKPLEIVIPNAPLVSESAVSKTPLGSPIPIEFRLVGDQEILASEIKAQKNQDTHTRIVGDSGMTIGSNIIVVEHEVKTVEEKNIVNEDIGTIKVENGIDEAFLLAQKENQTVVEIAEPLVIETTNKPVTLVSLVDLQPQIRQGERVSSVNVIRVPQKQEYQSVGFYDLLASNNASKVVLVNQNSRQRLDRANIQAGASGNASRSQFFEVVQTGQRPQAFISHGSFISQLPKNRGSAKRLDMVN